MEHAHILQATSSSSSSSTSSPPATSTTTSPSTPASPTPSTSSMNPVTTNPATNSSPPTSNRASGPTGGSSGRRKRLREEVNEEEEEKVDVGTNGTADEAPSLEDSLMFSDTSVALRIMRAQFPRVDKVSVEPFVLRSQLYSSVEDRTQVDRELETLKRENILRIFKLNTGQDDHAVMLLEDYLKQIERVTKRLEETKKDLFEVFEWFKKYVIDCKLEPSIDHQELCSLLSNGGKVKDGHISLLINAGLLTRQLIDPNMYWFAIPNIGSILKGISQGRKELLSLLNRRRYKEMMLALLEKKRLRMSPLDIRFHLRDLIGSGHLTTVSTPSGLVVQVTRD